MGASSHIRLSSASFQLDLSSSMPSKFCRAKLKIKREEKGGGGAGGRWGEGKGNYPLTVLKKMLINVLLQTKM